MNATNNEAVSNAMNDYFSELQKNISECYTIAEKARKHGLDPETTVEIPQASDLAARVEQLVGPKGIAPKIREVTKKRGDRELVSIEIAKQIAEGTTSDNIEQGIDQAIRTGLAILTEGVLVAPLEGLAGVKIKSNKDGTKYVDLYFSGPIRSAGGTAQAMSVLIADIVRRELGIERYKPTKGEIERYKEEIPLYKRAQHLQYIPTAEEIHTITSNCPICINGEGTEKEEVTGYRDLPRIETNRLRGGACLVIAEGLCLKAPKILKYVSKLKLEGWEFLKAFVKKDGKKTEEKKSKITPSSKYMGEVIAGRPVLSHPSRKGGFRLRYGRARTGGLASTAINPATMVLLDEFITVGTQMKTERPGKATIGTSCDEIEGPLVLLHNEDLIQLDSAQEAIKVKENIKQIIDVGEILVPYGEFVENNAVLPAASYTYEWWIQELQKELGVLPEKSTLSAIKEADKKTAEIINEQTGLKDELKHPSAEAAFTISEKFDVPLHPYYNLFWHDISKDELEKLASHLEKTGSISNEKTLTLTLSRNDEIKKILVELGATHRQRQGKLILERYSYPVIRCCGFDIIDGELKKTSRSKMLRNEASEDITEVVSQLAEVHIRRRSPQRIGARMGRPEKAALRKMRPPPHVLFPVGNYGTMQRLIPKAAEKGKIEVEAGVRTCPKCDRQTHRVFCDCGEHTIAVEGRIKTHQINIAEELQNAQQRLQESTYPEKIKGVMGTISKNKTPEPLEKGILRAKHEVYVFKDGTIRFDMTNAPLTHFKPKEINVSVEKLRELGYTHDYEGKELKDGNQICELKVHDIILSNSCGDYFVNVACFVDDLLQKFYGLPAFYSINQKKGLLGHLAVGLAPHTSAGAVSRIIGFTSAQVCFAHPYYHAAKRRNCDGDEDGLMLLLDAVLNFSHSYIPDKRGGKMDLPLILTTRIDPAEVDNEAHNVDVLPRYPLEFYAATLQHKDPQEVEDMMDLVDSRLGTPAQYEGFYFTHDTKNIGDGPPISSYKTLKSMTDKIDAQLNLAAKLRAVEEADVACKVIEKHFLPDILGNLRAFSKQSIRCPICNTIYRRIPLQGVCLNCGGSLTLTVHEKSVKKYLEISKGMSQKYNLPPYARQRINLVEKSINSIFESDKVKKTKLSDFI